MKRATLPVLPIAELADGEYYLNGNSGRGMILGMWDAGRQRFLCFKGPKFGTYDLYEMPHSENDDGGVIFEPVLNLKISELWTKTCLKAS